MDLRVGGVIAALLASLSFGIFGIGQKQAADEILGIYREREIRTIPAALGGSQFTGGTVTNTISVTNGSGTSSLGAAFLAINTTTANASGTFYVNWDGNVSASGTLQIYSSSSFRNDLTVSGDLLASSTLQATGLVTFYNGFISSASSSIAGNFTISSLINCNTIDTNAVGLLACGTDDTGTITNQQWEQINANFISPTTSLGIAIGTSTANPVGLFNVTTAGNVSASGTFYGFSSSSFARDLTVSGDLLASSTLQATGLAILYGGLLGTASSTFRNGLNVNEVLNSSSTLLAQTFVGYASSSFQNDLTISGDLLASSTLQVTGLATLYGGLISTASSSFAGAVTVGNLMSSGTIALADGYQMASALKETGTTIVSATTTDIITLDSFRRAVTIRSIESVIDCGTVACPARVGIRYNIRHGTDRNASTTAARLFDNDINDYSTTTLLSRCPTGTYSTACTITQTFIDNTLAANEMLWFQASTTAGSASTTAMNLSIKMYYDEQ